MQNIFLFYEKIEGKKFILTFVDFSQRVQAFGKFMSIYFSFYGLNSPKLNPNTY